jgi:hypothetical protein
VAGVIRALGDDANVGAVIDPEHVDAVFQFAKKGDARFSADVAVENPTPSKDF